VSNGEKIALSAKSWIGTPHVNMAKSKGHGVDCGMLLIASLEDSGLMEKDSYKIEPYSNEWSLHHSEEWFLRYVEAKCDKVNDLRIGDFLLYQYGRCISHGGVYVGDNLICHALIDQGVILTELNDVMFLDSKGQSRLRGIYRYRGI
jgi:cell wall-associated NlpC family hydrolase